MPRDRATTTSPAQLLGRLDHSAFTRRHGVIYGTALVGHFLDGFAINLTGVVLPGVIPAFHLSSKEAGYLSSVLFAGMLVGAAVAGVVSDRLGRKVPLAVCLLVFGGFSVLAACAWDYPSLMTARFCQGIGLGAEIAVVLPYITEFVPVRHRAPLVTSATAAWLIGLPVAAVVGAALVPALSWRAMFVVGTAPVLVSLVMLAVLPESVRYLLRRGRLDEARKTVDSLTAGQAQDPQEAPAAAAQAPAGAPPEEEGSARTPAGSVRRLLSARYARYTLSLWFMELCAGAFLYGLSTWLPSVLEKRGNSLLGSLTYTAIITATGVAGALIAGHLASRIGRRLTIGVSFVVSGLFCLLWGAVDATTAVVVLGCCATFFGSGLAGSTLFVYASELYPTAGRATGLGWAAAWQKAGGLIIPTVIGWILATHAPGYVFFVLFAGVSVLAGLSGLLVTFETRGRTVEEIAAQIAVRDRTPAYSPRPVPAFTLTRRPAPSPGAAPTTSQIPATELSAPDTTAQYDPEQAGEG
ncbi:MFS transporter [Streptomyces sulfonofaciens]|uniref:MFS transporter n=1 Tax=Streptomyces sulfonofaciens TaxID=68272 RepID=A0A919GQ06_9ACTN|nr:MFS transporter [Streptomyces sulfonofaciens]GHH87961.1 MFS transporter [Streptomyces sulfonofaciens]